MSTHRKETQAVVDATIYLLRAPYMYFPPWGDVWEANSNKEKAVFQRMARHKEIFETEQCSEFEAMLYISTASLEQPLAHDWSQVYFWLFRRYMPVAAAAIDAELSDSGYHPCPEELDPNERELLASLRRWMFRSQMARIKGTMQDASPKEVKKQTKQLQAEMPRLF